MTFFLIQKEVKKMRKMIVIDAVSIEEIIESYRKHGEWVRTEAGSEKPWKCSECGYQPVHYSTQVKPYEHYCGNCGVKMRGGSK